MKFKLVSVWEHTVDGKIEIAYHYMQDEETDKPEHVMFCANPRKAWSFIIFENSTKNIKLQNKVIDKFIEKHMQLTYEELQSQTLYLTV